MNNKLKTIALLIAAYLFIIAPAAALNLAQIDTQLRDKVGDNGPVDTRTWSDLTTKINIAQDILCIETDCLRRTFFLNTTAQASSSQTWRMTDTKLLKIYNVYFEDAANEGTYRKLDYTTIQALNKDNYNWQDRPPGRPLDWFINRYSTSTTSEFKIGVHPNPNTTYAGDATIRVDVSMAAEDLTTGSIPFNGDPILNSYHYLLIYKAAEMCMEESGDTNKRNDYAAKYREGIAIMRANLNDTASDKEGGITPAIRGY